MRQDQNLVGPGENLGSQKPEALSSRNLKRMRQNAEIFDDRPAE